MGGRRVIGGMEENYFVTGCASSEARGYTAVQTGYRQVSRWQVKEGVTGEKMDKFSSLICLFNQVTLICFTRDGIKVACSRNELAKKGSVLSTTG